jgi:hypothetical protein
MKTLIHNPWLWLGAYYVFSSIVSGMPAPDDKSDWGYRWAYASLHTLAGNIFNVVNMAKSGKTPALPTT